MGDNAPASDGSKGWWSGRSRAGKVLIIAGGLLLLIIIGSLAGSDTETTGGTEQGGDAPAAADHGGEPTPEPTPEPGVGDGTHVVGEDVQPGTYRSTGSGTCYWARLSGFSGELDDIIANGNQGPEIVTVAAEDEGFETNGCGRWVPVEMTGPAAPETTMSDGTFQVGVHIEPGRYRADGSGTCYWARLSDFSHDLDGIITNGTSPGIVEVAASDAGFSTFGCGMWNRVG